MEERLKKVEAENKDLVDRWMEQKLKDAERLNEVRSLFFPVGFAVVCLGCCVDFVGGFRKWRRRTWWMGQKFKDAERLKEASDFCCLSFSLLSRLVFWRFSGVFCVQHPRSFRTLLVKVLKTVEAESRDLVDGAEALHMCSGRTRRGAHLGPRIYPFFVPVVRHSFCSRK
jgi:hypothetical protein